MIWAFLLLIILGFTFVKIGTYSVWVTVLSFGIKLFTGFFLIILGIYLWKTLLSPMIKKIKKKNNRLPNST
ncbi:MAG: hypothetical protein DIZ80_09320 [endosymbiont of Galathealinum brachiosum]|uniref:Uncharacterized protein n=1 Tax=endosymbiont of Galathealinum brachiosum TaxID=2200906 RepID=A0A370DD28_9GAMM|nr:MAG: hypothetical protein DIZ80_09320 [endosymbiont of Galathealinum brachiosum]